MKPLFLHAWIAFYLGGSVALPSQAPTIPFAPDAALAAAMAADWHTVLRTSLPAAQAGDAVAQGLAGQAALWLGRSGDATHLLTMLNEKRQAAAWLAFTAALGGKPKPAMASYLRGDALARVGDADAALAAFEAAIAAERSCVPAHVARGVVLAGRGDHDGARFELDIACQLAPGTAEVHAALGTLFVLRRAAHGAQEAARRALAIAPDHALARNVLGCAKYGHACSGAASWSEAVAEFRDAFDLLPIPAIEENARMVQVAAERAAMPGMDDAPWFRGSDFLDWRRLALDSLVELSPVRVVVGTALPAALDEAVLERLNQELGKQDLAQRLRDRLAGRKLPARIADLPATTTPLSVAVLNRRLLEFAYPGAIVPHDQRMRPGMNLQTNSFLRHVPLFGSLSVRTDFSSHHRFGNGMSEHTYNRQVGGVEADLSKKASDREAWLVSAWFGLLHSFPRSTPAAAATAQEDRK